MRKLFVLFAASALFASCQREIHYDLGTGGSGTGGGSNPGSGGGTGGGSTTGTLLVKDVAVTGTETLTTLYTYDSQNRLATITNDGSSAGMTIHNYKRFERDALGRVVRTAQKEDVNVSIDTVFTLIHYPNSTTMEYDYSVSDMSMMGLDMHDSTAYVFTGGKLMSITQDQYMPLMGGTDPMASTKFAFTYDGSNRVSVINISSSTTPGTPPSPIAKETYTYGGTINAGWASASAAQNYWTGGMPNASNDAVTKIQIDNLVTPAGNSVVTVTFVMGPNNRPVSAKQVTTGGSPSTTNHTFYYQ